MRWSWLVLAILGCGAPTRSSAPASSTTPAAASPDPADPPAGPLATAEPAAAPAPAAPVAAPPAAPPPAAPLPAGDATRGEQLAHSVGCVACHSPDGTQLTGPTWKGAWGSQVSTTDGRKLVVDAELVRRSVLDPRADIVEGYQPVMPSFDGFLNDQDIADLAAYIATLK